MEKSILRWLGASALCLFVVVSPLRATTIHLDANFQRTKEKAITDLERAVEYLGIPEGGRRRGGRDVAIMAKANPEVEASLRRIGLESLAALSEEDVTAMSPAFRALHVYLDHSLRVRLSLLEADSGEEYVRDAPAFVLGRQRRSGGVAVGMAVESGVRKRPQFAAFSRMEDDAFAGRQAAIMADWSWALDIDHTRHTVRWRDSFAGLDETTSFQGQLNPLPDGGKRIGSGPMKAIGQGGAKAHEAANSVMEQLGVKVRSLDHEEMQRAGRGEGGVMVKTVRHDGVAGKGGLREGDIIVRVNGQLVKNASEFKTALDECWVGDAVKFSLVQDGKVKIVEVNTVEVETDGHTPEGRGGLRMKKADQEK